MGAAITSCLLTAIQSVEMKGQEPQANPLTSTLDFARLASDTFKNSLEERRNLGKQLGVVFARWLKAYCNEVCWTLKLYQIHAC